MLKQNDIQFFHLCEHTFRFSGVLWILPFATSICWLLGKMCSYTNTFILEHFEISYTPALNARMINETCLLIKFSFDTFWSKIRARIHLQQWYFCFYGMLVTRAYNKHILYIYIQIEIHHDHSFTYKVNW